AYTVNVDDLGLTEDEMADQYQYTKDIVTDSNGAIKGTTWQATPGLFAYRRSIAKDVLGTDDPTEVQEALSDWDKFNEVAVKASEKGYKMLSGYDDAYRTFSNNVSAPWVDGTTVKVDPNLMTWVEQTKDFTDKGYNNKTSLWDDGWAADQGPDGKVFGFFYSTWGINFTLLGNALETPVDQGGKEEVGNGIYGDYAVCEGPESYYWGGTWICGAAGTDNSSLVKDVMAKLTCDSAIMKQITLDTQDYTNNITAMNEIAADDTYGSDFLGGQNHVALFAKSAEKIDMSNAGKYDQGCNEKFQAAFKDYFDGSVDIDTAKANFETAIMELYPNLTEVVWP
ncbi:MAG: carbohydrate ABC transporter substrate-binding protein, partial [Eubacterium sp.]|nr:carbohydrate ABC transporter substrate-binding protein [Eubacterium sp.]